MVKRAILATALLVVLVLVVSGIYAAFFSSGSKIPARTARQIPTTAKPWNGQATRAYDTSFVRGADTITLQSMAFSNLDTEATNTSIALNVIPGPGESTKPSWLTPQAFQIRSASQRVYTDKVTVAYTGQGYTVTVTANRLPTDGLGATCSGPINSSDALGLFIFGPDGLFVVQLVPPPAPAGHCLSSVTQLPKDCQEATVTIEKIAHANQVRSAKIAHAHRASRARLKLDLKQAKIQEAPSLAAAKTTLAMSSCQPLAAPSPGHPLSSQDKRMDQTAAAQAAAAQA
jgi:hypothetical protein